MDWKIAIFFYLPKSTTIKQNLPNIRKDQSQIYSTGNKKK